MRSPQSILENLQKQAIKHKDDSSYRFTELYKHLLNPKFYTHAYAQLYSNKGAGTPGVDKQTMDGYSEEDAMRIIEELKDESYQPKPARRTYIPKKDGKKRPLGIPSIRDRLIQEIMNELLTLIYEPSFSKHSFGFRQGMSCHHALNAIKTTFQGTIWFVEGDIKGFFDNIDHHIMIETLMKKVDDNRFIRLVWKFLRAGYLEQWTFNKTYSGTPQGGIISPILANIYLNEFDSHMENMIEGFNKGECTSITETLEYKQVKYEASKCRKIIKAYRNRVKTDNEVHLNDDTEYQGMLRHYKQLKWEQTHTPRQEPHGRYMYKKLCYVRYADDFLIGVIGSKQDAEEIKQACKTFLQEQLKLELSEEKTLITHSSQAAKFLSYNISIHHRPVLHKKKTSSGLIDLRLNGKGNIKFTMPEAIIRKKLVELNIVTDINATKWKARRNTFLVNCSDLEIIDWYNGIIRGLYNYFRIANNVSYQLNSFYYVCKWSFFHTLASKYKSTLPKMLAKYRIGNTEEFGVPYKVKEGKKEVQRNRIFYHEGFKRNQYVKQAESTVDNLPEYHFMTMNELEKRILANKCEWCGKETKCHIHHVNAMKNIKHKSNPLYVHMARRNRKTINLCPECHLKQRTGRI